MGIWKFSKGVGFFPLALKYCTWHLMGLAMYMLATFLVFLYQDLYTYLGALFILGYLLQDAAIKDAMLLPWEIAAAGSRNVSKGQECEH